MQKVLLMLLLLQATVLFAQKPIYKDASQPIELRVKDLVSKMTVEEKILQLNQYIFGSNDNLNNIGETVKDLPAGIGSLISFTSDPVFRNQMQKRAVEQSRLGIPILFGYDVIHGYRTVYPISLAQACSWDPVMATQACGVAAKEAKASGIDWTFSPMIDVARDPRWGRVAEGYGEDPYTNAVFAVASVKGYQGNKLSDPNSIAACLKHYVAYGASEGGRDYHYSEVSAQSLWDTYLPPYKAAVAAGAATLMSSFNDISGVPGSANYYTLTEILKKRWKHDGFVVSDWDAIKQLINQGVAADRKEAGLKAFNAGVEMDMKDNIYFESLKELLAEKKITMARIDDAVSRILRVKFRLGLFEKPYTPIVAEQQRYLTADSKAIAQKLAEESMVLLKNNNQSLPLKSSLKKIALIGPLANDKENLLGSWNAKGRAEDVISIYEGLNTALNGKTTVSYAKGCDFDGDDTTGFEEANKLAEDADVIVLCLGEENRWTGENASRSTIALPRIQEKLTESLKKTGKPIILLLSNGRPLELERLEPMADAILETWQPGVMAGTAIANILTGKVNPSGKLAITFPLNSGQIPTYYDMRQAARPTSGQYQDTKTDPLYWFGYGLSYTSFKYDTVILSATKIKRNQKLTATVTVINTGNLDGKEAVLWYISHPAASISRPMKELKFFEKKNIPVGGSYTYKFEIVPSRDLSFPNSDGKELLEAGDYYLIVNGQKVHFTLVD